MVTILILGSSTSTERFSSCRILTSSSWILVFAPPSINLPISLVIAFRWDICSILYGFTIRIHISPSIVVVFFTFFAAIISLNVGANSEGTPTGLLVNDDMSLTLAVNSI